MDLFDFLLVVVNEVCRSWTSNRRIRKELLEKRALTQDPGIPIIYVSSSHIGFIQYSGIRAWCKLSRLILDFDKLAVRQLHVEPEGNRETKPVETIAGERVETWWAYHVPQLFWGTIQNMPPSCKLHFVTSKMGPPPPTKSETMKRHSTLSRPLPGSSHRSASGTQPIYKLPLKYPWWS